MTVVTLSKADQSSGVVRVYQLSLSPDLLGWHVVTTRWGKSGALRAERSDPFPTHGEARSFLADRTLVKVLRGYGPRVDERVRSPRPPDSRLMGALSWRQTQAIARSLHSAVYPEVKEDAQLELPMMSAAKNSWTAHLLDQCYDQPTLADRLYRPSFQLTLIRLLTYRDAVAFADDSGKVVRLVPRSVQSFTRYTLRTFFDGSPRLSPTIDILERAGFDTVADLVQSSPQSLRDSLGLTPRAVGRLRTRLAEVGLDFGMKIPRQAQAVN